ncbi:MAG: phage tail protein [Nitrospiraceae bacterium]
MPQFYKDCDESGPSGSVVDQPLRKFQTALKASYQDIRIKWLNFPYLWDAIAVPIAQLPQLGYNVGIDVDSTKAEGLQRSSVLNASQLWINKGTDKGYEITAAFEGLLVTVTPLWAQTCGPSMLQLGSIGQTSSYFDLSTTLLQPRPVSPGTVHVQVTTALGVEEDIRDDGLGNLVGYENQANGPLTRLNLIAATTMSLTTIVGVFQVGDTVTQGPAAGVILAFSNNLLTVRPVSGSFGTGTIIATGTGATATVTGTSADIIEQGETFEGLTSGTTAVMRKFQGNYGVIDRITSGSGFTINETLRGRTSGGFAVAGTAVELIQGPLQATIGVTNLIGTISIDDEVTGSVSGATGAVQVVGSGFISVDTITQPGFLIGETLSVGANSVTITSIDFGTIDYISGQMEGLTVALQELSTVNAVVDLMETGPTQFLANYDDVIADDIPMDDIQSDRYARWPVTYYPIRLVNGILTPGECRSYSLRLFFFTPDDTEIEDFLDVANRIQLSLERFRPLHVRFDKIRFDGARASSQVWRTGEIAAGAAAASVWTATVVGEQVATSQVWTFSSLNATVAT